LNAGVDRGKRARLLRKLPANARASRWAKKFMMICAFALHDHCDIKHRFDQNGRDWS
jgi:hypothetical protein